MPVLGPGINLAREKGVLFPRSPGCERGGLQKILAATAFYQRRRAGAYKQTCVPAPLCNRTKRAKPMLFWIAAIGSTWGAYALGYERLIDASDPAEASHGGRENRRAEDRRRNTDSNG
jgi:hypothetical protein